MKLKELVALTDKLRDKVGSCSVDIEYFAHDLPDSGKCSELRFVLYIAKEQKHYRFRTLNELTTKIIEVIYVTLPS
jgi:hypothetical protein